MREYWNLMDLNIYRGRLNYLRSSRARIGEMLNSKIIENNWGKVLFCIDIFSNFASEIRSETSGSRSPDVAGRNEV